MKLRTINTFLLFFLAWFSFADGKPKNELSIDKFYFINIQTKTKIGFDTDIGELEKKIGSSENGLNNTELSITWPGLLLKVNPKWEYDQATKKYQVIPNKYLISNATIQNTNYSTIDGVSIGDDLSKLLKIYGEPYRKTNDLYQYLHNEPDEVWNLTFFLVNTKVNKISIIRGD